MAVIYLRSTDGSDSDDGSTWALAKATLAAALTAAGAGGTVYVSQAHAETQASVMTLASPGTAGAITNVICVNDSATPPTTLATTATVSTTGASSITINGCMYCYGVTFRFGSATNSAIVYLGGTAYVTQIFEACVMAFGTSYSPAMIRLGGASSVGYDTLIAFINTVVSFASTSQTLSMRSCDFRWSKTPSAIAGSVPTVLLTPSSLSTGVAKINGVDLSSLGSGKSLVAANVSANVDFSFANCELGSSVSVLSGAITDQGGVSVSVDNCDSSDTNYRMEHYKYQGSIKSETSKIRSGGASDGTTPISWNMTSLAGASFVSPLESPPISIWNETTGSSKTVMVEIAQDNAATALNNDEIWIEVEYLGTSGYPISSIASDRKSNILSSAVAQTTSSATWDNMTSPTKQKLEVSFTPQEKGLFTARVMLAKPSVTVYVDPLLTVS